MARVTGVGILIMIFFLGSACSRVHTEHPPAENSAAEGVHGDHITVKVQESLSYTYPSDAELSNWRRDSDPLFKVKVSEKGPELYIEKEDKEFKVGELEILKKGTYLYHWGTPEAAALNDRRGFVDPKELDRTVNSKTDRVMVQGNGYYVSTLIWDTQNYGPEVVIVIPPQDLLIASTDLVQENEHVWPEKITDLEARKEKIASINRGLRAAGVHGVIQEFSQGLNGWLNLLHSDSVRHVVSNHHPWIVGTEREFYHLIRDQKLEEGEHARLLPKMEDILEETVGRQMCSHGFHFQSEVKNLFIHFPQETEKALITALEREQHNQEGLGWHSPLSAECMLKTLQEFDPSPEFIRKVTDDVRAKFVVSARPPRRKVASGKE